MTGVMTAMVLIGVAFSTLWVGWRILALVFSLIDYWHAAARVSREDSSANKGLGL